MMKKILTVQVTLDGHRDPTPSTTIAAMTITGFKRQINAAYKQSFNWLCIAGDKELVILDLYEAKHSFAVCRYTEHEVIGDD